MFRSAATRLAHNTTIPSLGGNKDLRPLQDLITAEKAVLVSLQRLSVDFTKASEALKSWGLGEGDDVGDISNASSAILSHFSSALSQYASHEHAIRDHMKAVRSREESLGELKRHRKSVADKADSADKKLSKMSPEHKNLQIQTDTLNKLREEIRSLDSDIMTQEAQLGDFKRTSTRAILALKFGGLLECCEKGTIAAEFGKLVTAEIPEEITQPGMSRSMYTGHAQTESFVAEASRCVGEVVFTNIPPSKPPRFRQASELSDGGYIQGGMGSFDGGMGNLQGGMGSPQGSWSHQDNFGSGSQNYIPTPQGPGPQLGPSETSSFGPSDRGGYHPTQLYPQPDPHPPPRSVDDFGVNQFSSPKDAAANPGGGGRFATFPVKVNRGPGPAPGPGPGPGSGAGSGFSLRDDPPSLGRRGHEQAESFSSSVANALGASVRDDVPPINFGEVTPSYEVTHASSYAPPPGPPPGAAYASEANLWPEPQGNRRASYISQTNSDGGDAQLAYMSDPPLEPAPRHSEDREDKHVRFGGVSDVEEELQKREAAAVHHLNEYPPSSAIGNENLVQEPVDSPPRENGRFVQYRVPPPVEPEEERALNVAAAREVSRELDALTFNPPSPINMNIPSYAGTEDQPSLAVQIPPPREPSPLIPPAPPFARGSVSPRPTVDTTVLGTSLPHSSSPIQPRPRSQGSGSTSPSSPTAGPTNPNPATSSPLTAQPIINLPTQESIGSMPAPSPSPYRTPPEYPRGLGTSPLSSPMSKSTSSLTSSISPPAGTRTISAAAFRRPPPRMASGEGGLSDTSPLSFKKRLPSSPYPQYAGTGLGARDTAAGPGAGYGMGRNRADSNPVQQKNAQDTEEDYDYLSAYVDSDPNGGSPQHEDHGNLGKAQVANDTSPRPTGYAVGRFATDLDGDGLR